MTLPWLSTHCSLVTWRRTREPFLWPGHWPAVGMGGPEALSTFGGNCWLMRETSGLGRKLEPIIKQMAYKFQRQEMVVIPVSKGLQRVNRAKPLFFFCKSYSICRWGLTDGVYLCFSKSFHTMPHSIFREKMDRCGLDVLLPFRWFRKGWTASRALINVATTMVICSEGQTQGQGYSKHLVNICWSY